MGELASDLPFPCKGEVECEGLVNTHWVRVSLDEQYRVRIIEVIYNGKTLDGHEISDRTVDLVDALRENSLANVPKPFMLASVPDESRSAPAGFADLNNAIVYLEDSTHTISSAVYVQRDAPVLATAIRSPGDDIFSKEMYHIAKRRKRQ